ncbi:hypothetical protein Q8F55_003411 [Vanrija albida]|uniref:GP-PDE domain-containing protein n=1 Tax=Vanrija albida TaxID=181172 RepID=A0ABR3Q4Y4_9TREE
MPAPTRLSVHDILDLFRNPQPGLLVSAHRGLRWDGVPENSTDAVLNAARAGLLCIEVDLRLTSDGTPILFHDRLLGRTTNIAEHLARKDIYSPYTGKGYAPPANSLPWSLVRQLKVKNEHGKITDEGILDFATFLDLIKAHGIDIIVFLDVKDKESMPIAYDVMKTRTNARGAPASDWCVWKPVIEFYPTPAELEAESWFQHALATSAPQYIPVFEPSSAGSMDVLAAAKAYATRPYTLALEVGLRAPDGPLRSLVDWARGAGIALGWFGTLGDIHPADGRGEVYDLAGFDLAAYQKPGAPLVFDEGIPPTSYDNLLAPGDAPDGKDWRYDLELFKSLGYTWVIADLTHRSASLFEAQSAFQQPTDRVWRDARIAQARGI